MTIKELRLEKGLTRAAFARSLGISLSSLDGYESGKRNPGAKALAAIMDVYGLDLSSPAPDEAAELEAIVETALEAEAGEAIEAEAEEAVEADIEEAVEAEAEEAAEADTEEAVEAEAEEAAESDVEEAAEAETEVAVEAETEVAFETETEVAAEAETEVAAEAETEVAAEAETEVAAEAGTEEAVEAEAEEAAQAEAEEAAQADTEEAVEAEAEETAQAETEVAAEAETEEAAESDVEETAQAETEETVEADTEEGAEAGTEEAALAAALEKAARKAKKKARKAEKLAARQRADEEATQRVVDIISALCDGVNLDDKDAVNAARDAYDSLTDDQELMIPGDVLRALFLAEQAIESAEEAAAKKASKSVPIGECRITVKDVAYTGKKIKKPSVKVTCGETELKPDEDYSLKYDKKARDIGLYLLTIKGKGRFSGSTEAPFCVVPKASSFTRLLGDDKQAAKEWKLLKNIEGCQIEYSLDKDLSDSKKVKLRKPKDLAKALKKLKAGKKYYLRVRIFATIKKKHHYSDWSKVKTLKL